MPIEIDILSVGDGDAIALRYVYPTGGDFVAVIDGGYSDDGYKLIDVIQNRYGRTSVDLVVSTHPDQDHISGLITLVKNIVVGKVWVHDPSKHPIGSASLAIGKAAYGLHRDAALLMKSLGNLEEFIQATDALGIEREEPFSGMKYGPIQVVGPSVSFYEQMLTDTAKGEGMTIDGRLMLEQESLGDFLLASQYAIDENNETSPTNESSAIVTIVNNDLRYLFTGDAGVRALTDCQTRWDFSNLHWLDVPHHGSRRNLTNELVEYLNPEIAFVSAKGDRKHPSTAVVNALKRVDCTIYSTHKGGSLWHRAGVSDNRTDYSTAQPL